MCFNTTAFDYNDTQRDYQWVGSEIMLFSSFQANNVCTKRKVEGHENIFYKI